MGVGLFFCLDAGRDVARRQPARPEARFGPLLFSPPCSSTPRSTFRPAFVLPAVLQHVPEHALTRFCSLRRAPARPGVRLGPLLFSPPCSSTSPSTLWPIFVPSSVLNVGGREYPSGGLRFAPAPPIVYYVPAMAGTCIQRAPPPTRVRGWTRLRKGTPFLLIHT